MILLLGIPSSPSPSSSSAVSFKTLDGIEFIRYDVYCIPVLYTINGYDGPRLTGTVCTRIHYNSGKDAFQLLVELRPTVPTVLLPIRCTVEITII